MQSNENNYLLQFPLTDDAFNDPIESCSILRSVHRSLCTRPTRCGAQIHQNFFAAIVSMSTVRMVRTAQAAMRQFHTSTMAGGGGEVWRGPMLFLDIFLIV